MKNGIDFFVCAVIFNAEIICIANNVYSLTSQIIPIVETALVVVFGRYGKGGFETDFIAVVDLRTFAVNRNVNLSVQIMLCAFFGDEKHFGTKLDFAVVVNGSFVNHASESRLLINEWIEFFVVDSMGVGTTY